VAILLRLRQSQATFAELAEEVGLARSTTHHHLAQLRAAGLIAMRGNARAYRYGLDPDGFAAAEALLGTLPGE
jgi:DNA-binding IclR family transcriptional regulator